MLIAETVARVEDREGRRMGRKARRRDAIMIVMFWEGTEQETKCGTGRQQDRRRYEKRRCKYTWSRVRGKQQ